jgi:acyl dehydratase
VRALTSPATISLRDLSQRAGSTFGPSAPLTVDQVTIDGFAALTRDRQWVHVDTARAEREIGGALAHGYLTLSLVPYFVSELLQICDVGRGLNYGSDRVRFPAPLRAGSAVTATLKILDYAPRGPGGLLRMEVAISPVDAEIPVCVAETLTLLFPGDGVLGQ